MYLVKGVIFQGKVKISPFGSRVYPNTWQPLPHLKFDAENSLVRAYKTGRNCERIIVFLALECQIGFSYSS